MTGINIPSKWNHSNKSRREESPAQQYKNKKLIPERYSIIQLGISLFEKKIPSTTTTSTSTDGTASSTTKTPPSIVTKNNSSRGYAIPDVNRTTMTGNNDSSSDNKGPSLPSTSTKDWIVRKYNFYMFPDSLSTREVLLNPGAIAFLQSHNMSLDTWCSQGIPYVCSNAPATDDGGGTVVQEAIRIVQNYVKKTKIDMDDYWNTTPRGKHQMSSSTSHPIEPSVENTVKRTIELTRPSDIGFYARVMASIREWLDNPLTPSAPNMGETQQQHHVWMAHYLAQQQDQALPQQQQQDQEQVINNVNHPENNNNLDNQPTTNNGNLADNRDVGTSSSTRTASSTSFLLPPCNSFLRRALYESIQLEYPTLITEKVGSGNQQQIRVLRLSDEEKYIRYLNLMRDRWNSFVLNHIGMFRIYCAITLVARGYQIPSHNVLFAKSFHDVDWSTVHQTNKILDLLQFDRNRSNDNMISSSLSQSTTSPRKDHTRMKHTSESVNSFSNADVAHGDITALLQRGKPVPIVVHNGYMDLLFLLTHFYCPILPSSYLECKKLISCHFPIIYDTKVLATEGWFFTLNHMINSGNINSYSFGIDVNLFRIEDTSLGNLYKVIVLSEQRRSLLLHPDSQDAGDTFERGTYSHHMTDQSNNASFRILDQMEIVDTPYTSVEAGTVSAVIPNATSSSSTSRGYGRGGGNTPVANPDLRHGVLNNTVLVSAADQEHEAAYDAYMTGAIFIGLCQLIWHVHYQQANSSRRISTPSTTVSAQTSSKFHEWDQFMSFVLNGKDDFCRRNRLYQMSIFTLDFENMKDPLKRGMLINSTYRIAGIDKSISTHDIVRCLGGLVDEHERPIHFDIIWIDDTTFLVAAVYRGSSHNSSNHNNTNNLEGTLRGSNQTVSLLDSSSDSNYEHHVQQLLIDHGIIIFKTLSNRFQTNNKEIITLEEHLKSLQNDTLEHRTEQNVEPLSWTARALSFFGIPIRVTSGDKRKLQPDGSSNESKMKRQR